MTANSEADDSTFHFSTIFLYNCKILPSLEHRAYSEDYVSAPLAIISTFV